MVRDEEADRELQRLEEITILRSIYYRNKNNFQRNPKLSHVVHAVMNFGQLLSVIVTEVFHHLHHAINRKMQSKDSTVPSLPEERNPMFIAYPICVVTSLVLCVLWLRFRNLERILDMTLVGCTIGVGLMLGSGILSMRHAEIYINLEEVSDDQLLTHPIFLHNFILCILAILSMSIYLIHFWIVYDCWLWRKNERALENSTSSSASSSQSSSESSSQEDAQRNGQPSTSRRNDREKPRDTDPISMFEAIKNKLLNVDATNSIDEPVMLYCCCVDCWTYLKKREPGTQEYEL